MAGNPNGPSREELDDWADALADQEEDYELEGDYIGIGKNGPVLPKKESEVRDE